MRRVVAGIALSGLLVWAASLRADRLELINHVNLWTGSPVRSADPAGIAYHPGSGRLLIADSEISEYGEATDGEGRPIFEGVNLFETPLDLSARLEAHLAAPGEGCPCEPVGLAFNPLDGHVYGTDDDPQLRAAIDMLASQ